MDREKRRNVIKKIVRFWLKHELAIAIGLVAIFICTAITVLYVCFADRKTVTETVSSQQDYSSIFDTDESGQIVKNTRKNRTVVTSTTPSGEVIEEEYKTILEYNANTKPGYMNNCIFWGDSRAVAMVAKRLPHQSGCDRHRDRWHRHTRGLAASRGVSEGI